MRIYLGLFALVFLAMAGRAEPAAAQCDPVVCANPYGAGAKATHHRHKHKHRKTPKERPQFMRY